MKRMKGLTLVELLVAVAVIALLIVVLVLVVHWPKKRRELSRQAVCMANLSGISKGLMIYASENNRYPPILPDIDRDTAEYADDLRMGEECTAADLGAGAQQNLCLLVKGGFVPWGIFICPSSGNTEAADRGDSGRRYGMGEAVDGKNISYCDYGIQIPYTHKGDNLCPLTKHMDGGIVILGDRAPEGDLKTKWSRNHPDYGESLLYAAGNVKFSKDKAGKNDKNTGGWGGNNVYTRDNWKTDKPENPILISNGSAAGYPASTKDTVLYSWGD